MDNLQIDKNNIKEILTDFNSKHDNGFFEFSNFNDFGNNEAIVIDFNFKERGVFFDDHIENQESIAKRNKAINLFETLELKGYKATYLDIYPINDNDKFENLLVIAKNQKNLDKTISYYQAKYQAKDGCNYIFPINLKELKDYKDIISIHKELKNYENKKNILSPEEKYRKGKEILAKIKKLEINKEHNGNFLLAKKEYVSNYLKNPKIKQNLWQLIRDLNSKETSQNLDESSQEKEFQKFIEDNIKLSNKIIEFEKKESIYLPQAKTRIFKEIANDISRLDNTFAKNHAYFSVKCDLSKVSKPKEIIAKFVHKNKEKVHSQTK